MMKKDNKKALYENIMTSVAKEVKKVLNEDASRSRMPKNGVVIRAEIMTQKKDE